MTRNEFKDKSSYVAGSWVARCIEVSGNRRLVLQSSWTFDAIEMLIQSAHYFLLGFPYILLATCLATKAVYEVVAFAANILTAYVTPFSNEGCNATWCIQGRTTFASLGCAHTSGSWGLGGATHEFGHKCFGEEFPQIFGTFICYDNFFWIGIFIQVGVQLK